MSLPTIGPSTGTLLGDIKTGTTRTGGVWAAAVVKFQAWRRHDGEWTEGDSVIASVIGFDDVARSLVALDLKKGDALEIEGSANVGEWSGKPQLRITLSAVRRPAKRQPDAGNHHDAQSIPAQPGPGRTQATRDTSGAPSNVTRADFGRDAMNRLRRSHEGNPRFNRNPA